MKRVPKLTHTSETIFSYLLNNIFNTILIEQNSKFKKTLLGKYQTLNYLYKLFELNQLNIFFK